MFEIVECCVVVRVIGFWVVVVGFQCVGGGFGDCDGMFIRFGQNQLVGFFVSQVD